MTNTTNALDLTADIIDVRDIISRYEDLVELLDIDAREVMPGSNGELEALRGERSKLEDLLSELRGNGGDEEWRGDWYPSALIRDSHFEAYVQELLEDCGYIPKDFPDWIEIDWRGTARNVEVDYTACEIDGVTYWYR